MTKHKKNIKPTSFEEFKSYLTGKLSEKEQHILEKKWTEDDFEREALEGFEKFNIPDIENDVADLRKKIRSTRAGNFSYLKIAAVVALFISVTVVFFLLVNPERSPELSQKSSPPSSKEQMDNEEQEAEPSSVTESDSILISQQYAPQQEAQTLQKENTNPPASFDERNEAESLAPAYSPEVVLPEDSEIFYPEISTEDASTAESSPADKKDYSIQKIRPIKETELEPIPETGNFNRVASAKVKPSQNYALNEKKRDLPSRLEYPEGINDLPNDRKTENLSVTMAGKTFSKTAKAKTEVTQEATPYSGNTYNKLSESERSSGGAQPEGGYEAYYEYLYEKIQSPDVSKNELPKTVDIKITLSEEGDIKEIAFLSDIDNELGEDLRKILLSGPKWHSVQKENETVDLKLEFKD